METGCLELYLDVKVHSLGSLVPKPSSVCQMKLEGLGTRLALA